MPGCKIDMVSRDTICPLGKWNSEKTLFVKYINIVNDHDHSETEFGVYICDSLIEVLPEFIYEDNRVLVSGKGKIISFPELQGGKELPLDETIHFKIIKE